jgi:alkanesulfonate monooxygenase SsuD/methylene tetrahydromethanopterin reductase-like flavin-dependent oxidoreductase (luciferase family)
VKHAIDVAPFRELADPRVLAELAIAAEERGWDGFFIWDHIGTVHRLGP